jgi:DNA-binding NtrC family response regulator
MISPTFDAVRGATTKHPFTILVVEDQAADAELFLHAIEQADLQPVEGDLDIVVRASAEGALRLLGERPVDLVLTDMMLPGMDGLDLVSRIQDIDRNLPVLVVTRLKGIPEAVDAIRRGAYDYVLKPVNAVDLGMRLHRAIRISEIMRRNSSFERTMRQAAGAGELIGASPAFQEVLRLVQEAAAVRSTVLITGETGTGKGLIARAIHERSRESGRPFQVIDCATMPEGVVESELFGHVRGAFTGAVSDKPGLIELAEGGTVFLDEIGELPLALQAKLLRVLEENEVRPVGGTRVKRVDMRFIAATNQDLGEKVKSGAFRKDLFYRLAVVSIRVPPLRERIEDIPPIARHFVGQFGRELGRPQCRLDAAAMEALIAYPWPGNVRELRNVIERAVMLAKGDTVTRQAVTALFPSEDEAAEGGAFSAYLAGSYAQAKRRLIEDFTAAYLKARLAASQGQIQQAAQQSGMPRQNFSRLLRRYLGREPG